MENKKNDTIKKFLVENKQEIPDNGFTQKVISRLPAGSRNNIIIGFFAYAGITISLFLAFFTGLIQKLLLVVAAMPLYYLLIAVAVFPLLYMGLLLAFTRGSRFRFI